MSDYKQNWRNYRPPAVPIFFMEYEALKEMLERNAEAISVQGLDVMLGYFEEFEKFEKASLVRDAKMRLGLISGEELLKIPPSPNEFRPTRPNFPPPDDNEGWIPSPDGTHWMRKPTEEEIKRYLGENYKKDDDENDEFTNPLV